MDEYLKMKLNMVKNVNEKDFIIYNSDDKILNTSFNDKIAKKIPYSLNEKNRFLSLNITKQYNEIDRIDHNASIDELFEEQLEVSDIVLVTRSDILNDDQFDIVKNKIKRRLNSSVPVLKSKNGKIDLKSALKKLGEMGINNLLLEAGSGLNGAMMKSNLIDEIIIYTAPVILGSDAQAMMELPFKKMSEKISLNIVELTQVASDLKIRARPL